MKAFKAVVIVAASLLGLAVVSTALAHPPRGRAHVGLYVGVPLGWPYWGPIPYYAPAVRERIVVVPSEPTVYLQRPDAQPEAGYWYYCADAGAYYPYVKECAGGWQRVPPRPAGQ